MVRWLIGMDRMEWKLARAVADGERKRNKRAVALRQTEVSPPPTCLVPLAAVGVGWTLFAATSVFVKGTASPHADADLSYRVNDAQLRLVQANFSEVRKNAMRSVLKKQLSIPFVSWVVERVNLPVISANTKYTQLFDIHRNCRQVVMVIPEQGQSDPLKSFSDNQSEYRFSLDTHYTTGRYIVISNRLNTQFQTHLRIPIIEVCMSAVVRVRRRSA